MEIIGIFLNVDKEKHQLQVNENWYPFERGFSPGMEWIGHLVRAEMGASGKIRHLEVLLHKIREAKGKIQSLNLGVPRVSMHFEGRLIHFYVPPYLFRSMKEKFRPGNFLRFQYYEQKVVINKVSYLVIAKVLADAKKKPELHSSPELNKTLVTLKKTQYFAFMDLEFSMTGPEYRGKPFVSEIIQVGVILTDASGNLVEKFSSYIRPTAHPKVTGRTTDFLKINKDAVATGMGYRDFYKIIKDIIQRFNPMFFVWGANDGFMLKSSYEVNRLEPLFAEGQIINLQQVHRQYFEVGQDIGLYNALKSYGLETGIQIHDALVDALILSHIFFQFRNALELPEKFPFKEKYEGLMHKK
ncbi:MAG: exonuclease domain-containing protein [Turicibacter sp.]|nr:exonuclease domain-containing protein [Turicibacter sp.]